MELGLSGRTALVAAALSPISVEIARLLVAEGAAVTLCGADDDAHRAAATDVGARYLAADLTTDDGLQTLESALPDVHLVVQDIGARVRKAVLDASDDEWRRGFEGSAMTSVRLARAYLPKMLSAGTGRIVVITSVAAVMPIDDLIVGSAGQSAQLAIMRGLAMLTKGTAVTVNAVLAGPTPSAYVKNEIVSASIHRHAPAGAAERSFMEERVPTALADHLVDPKDVAALVTFLLGAGSSATNGAILRADGGVVPTLA